MIAGHIEPELFQYLEVGTQGLVRRRGVEAVRPETLVERAEHETGFVVQVNSEASPGIARKRNFSQAEITADFVHDSSTVFEADLEVIKMRVVGRPRFWIFDSEIERGRVAAAGSADFVASIVRDRLDASVSNDPGNAGDD